MPDGAKTVETARPDQPAPGIGFTEFVVLIAGLTALTALTIDIMLPAFPEFDGDFGLTDDNHRQAVITVYMIGFSAGQILYGPFSDTFGRRPMVFLGLGVFIAASLLAVFAESFAMLLAARALQGIGSAAPRVIAFAVIRDCFGGRAMARVMSLVMMVFIAIPVVAPSIGQGVMLFGSWRWIFGFLVLYSAIVLAWTALRLPETLHPEYRRRLSGADLRRAVMQTVTSRQTLGYAIAVGFMFGALMTYIGLSQQIFQETYRLGEWFPLVFGGVALSFAVATYLNSKLVLTIGMHRLSHLATIGFVIVTLFHAALSLIVDVPLPAFIAIVSLSMFLFGVIGPNFNALAMEPQAENAGMASSFLGAYSTASSAGLGWFIGQQYDGSIRALTIGFAGLALATLVTVLIVEKGRLAVPVEGAER